MGSRAKRVERCEGCRLHPMRCLCATLPRFDLATRLVLCMHYREVRKVTATGPWALTMLGNSELRIHGERDHPLDLAPLYEEGRRVLVLYPSDDAVVLDEELLSLDRRPVTLIVPDGNWRQAARAARRIPGIERAERVVLPKDRPTAWGVRTEPKEGGLATFEAIARALGVLESNEVRAGLEAAFERLVAATFAARGQPGEKNARQMPLPPPPDEPEEEVPLTILYQDAHVVVIDKPAGSLVHRGWGTDPRPLLQKLRDQLGSRVYPVHRLDRSTSGALLFALTPEDARLCQIEFENGRVDKRYLALCRGHDPKIGRVDHPIAAQRGGEKKPAVTDFRLLGASGRYGLVEARPHTGRAHQIRRHLKHLSHPLVGDVRYGKGEHNRYFREEHDFHRLALHATRLTFAHPRTGAELSLTAPLPADFARVLEALGLADEARAAFDRV